MFEVRLNVGMRGKKRGDVVKLSPAEYAKIKGFVTVLSAPVAEVVTPKAKPKVTKQRSKKKESDNGVLRSERSEAVKSVDADHVGRSNDEGEKDQS